jgi:hypothetical protein
MAQNNSSVQQTINQSAPYALRYTGMLNSVFSVLAFNLAIACISTENPPFYAWLSLIFIFVVWNSAIHPYRSRLRILRAANHPLMEIRAILLRSIPFFAGWLFLGLVAVGTLDKNGWLGTR